MIKHTQVLLTSIFVLVSSMIQAQESSQNLETGIIYKSLNSEVGGPAAAMIAAGANFEFNVLTEKGESAGVFVGDGSGGVTALANGLPPNWSIKALEPNQGLGEIKGMSVLDAWEYTSPDATKGYWFPNEELGGKATAGFLKAGNSTKVKANSAIDKIARAYSRAYSYYGAAETTRETIAELMVDEAKQIACRQQPRTTQFTVTASLGASVTFIAGIEGSINYTGTWNTDDLCN